MLLATPQLAFAQDSLAVTVDPRSLDIDEDADGTYEVKLDAEPSEDVMITVVGGTGVVTVDPRMVTLTSTNWEQGERITVTAPEDMNAVDETVTLTHTATVGEDEDEVTLRNVSVIVRVKDNDTRGVTVTADPTLEVGEAASNTYTIVLDTERPRR